MNTMQQASPLSLFLNIPPRSNVFLSLDLKITWKEEHKLVITETEKWMNAHARTIFHFWTKTLSDADSSNTGNQIVPFIPRQGILFNDQEIWDTLQHYGFSFCLVSSSPSPYQSSYRAALPVIDLTSESSPSEVSTEPTIYTFSTFQFKAASSLQIPTSTPVPGTLSHPTTLIPLPTASRPQPSTPLPIRIEGLSNMSPQSKVPSQKSSPPSETTNTLATEFRPILLSSSLEAPPPAFPAAPPRPTLPSSLAGQTPLNAPLKVPPTPPIPPLLPTQSSTSIQQPARKPISDREWELLSNYLRRLDPTVQNEKLLPIRAYFEVACTHLCFDRAGWKGIVPNKERNDNSLKERINEFTRQCFPGGFTNFLFDYIKECLRTQTYPGDYITDVYFLCTMHIDPSIPKFKEFYSQFEVLQKLRDIIIAHNALQAKK